MKMIKYLVPAVALMLGLASCDNMDELYKDYRTDVSIYSTKVSGVAVQPGFKRATVSWNKPEDAVAKGIELSWNDGENVIVIDSLASTYEVTGLANATYTFEVKSIDAYGNRSLPVQASAKVYGEQDTETFTTPSFALSETANYTHALTIKNLSGAMNMWGGVLKVTISNGTESHEIDLSQEFNILAQKNGGKGYAYYSRLIDKTVDLGVALAPGQYNVTCEHSQHCTSFQVKANGVFYYTAICVDPLTYTAEGVVTASEIVVPEPEEPAEGEGEETPAE